MLECTGTRSADGLLGESRKFRPLLTAIIWNDKWYYPETGAISGYTDTNCLLGSRTFRCRENIQYVLLVVCRCTGLAWRSCRYTSNKKMLILEYLLLTHTWLTNTALAGIIYVYHFFHGTNSATEFPCKRDFSSLQEAVHVHRFSVYILATHFMIICLDRWNVTWVEK